MGSNYRTFQHFRRFRRGKSGRRLIGSVVTLVVLSAGFYGFQPQYPAARTGRACSGILVTAESPYDTEVTEAVRGKLARAATGTAQRAAEKTGCETEAGDASALAAPVADARTVPPVMPRGPAKG